MAMVDTGICGYGGYKYQKQRWKLHECTCGNGAPCRLWTTVYTGICSYDGGYRYLWYVTGYKYLLLWLRIQVPVAMVEDTGNCDHRGR
jgi:hypothetical protein